MATVLFVAPHQDDETLSMGSATRRHLEAVDAQGQPLHDVHVLLLTAGSGSGAQAKTSLNDAGFSTARDDELVRAWRALGGRFSNVHFADRTVGDTALTVDEAQTAIAAFAATHPGVWVKTYTDRPLANRHQDHVNAGKAAVALLNAGVLAPNTLRLYVEPWLVGEFRAAHPSLIVGAERASAVMRVQKAFDEYGDVDHIGGRYGIGHLSVGNIFAAHRPDPVNYYHVP